MEGASEVDEDEDDEAQMMAEMSGRNAGDSMD